MANANLQYPQQEYGTGSTLALAASEYEAAAITKFNENLVFGQYVYKKAATAGTYADRFTAIANTEAEDMERGVQRTGSNQPESEGRVLTLDTKQVVADHYHDEITEFINHVNTRAAYAAEDAHACAKTVDLRLSACISIGARVAARGTGADQFPGGKIVTAATAGAIGAAYPRSLAGSRALQDDLAEIAVDFDEKNLPRPGRVAFLGPYLADVLLQDKTLVSYDYQRPNDMLTRKVVMVAGFVIEMTTNLNTLDWQSYGQPNYATQTLWGSTVTADFQKVVCQCLATRDAVGQLMALGDVRPFGPEEIKNMHSWYFGCKVWQGAGVLRPEACAEIVLQ